IRRLSASQRPVFLVNSRLGLFTATSSGSSRKGFHPTEAPLLPKVRGQFAEFLNRGSLARLRILSPPTCVGLRYGRQCTSLEAFLGSVGSASSLLYFAPHHGSGSRAADLPTAHPTRLDRDDQRPAAPTLLRHPIAQTVHHRHGNINPLSIAYAFRPRLRSRLTLSGRTFLRKP